MKSPLINKARHLRNNPTLSEKRLWNILRCKRLNGFKFRRKHPIYPYIVDFACLSNGLIIEIYDRNRVYDPVRDKFLRNKGFTIINIGSHEINGEVEKVIHKLIEILWYGKY